MKTLQVLTVLAASAVLSTGALAGSSGSSSGVTISGPLLNIITSDGAANAKSTAIALGNGTVSQIDLTSVTPTATSSGVSAQALGANGAFVNGRASTYLNTTQTLIVGY